MSSSSLGNRVFPPLFWPGSGSLGTSIAIVQFHNYTSSGKKA
ncbi:24426_t:CDS:2 [Dentiscutata erythropus]|uniref:24426_t:CDS:1 n=1 Tax=Dentiscutata erythropus TaxID=1348616 RepID=A0A9N9EKI8_9GLOM|nr:24426_t:CDS:2 [Dentiscutata erythropus]